MQIKTKKVDGTAKVYDLYRVSGNRAEYIAAGHSDLYKDKVIVSSTAGGVTRASLGNRKASINFVKAHDIKTRTPLTEVADAKIEILSSLPAGMSDDQVLELVANAREFFTQSVDELVAIIRTGKIS